ncbi:MAG: peptidase [Armatimonadetes bacterium]|nr:peptidase [Armatimonadota bacterium]
MKSLRTLLLVGFACVSTLGQGAITSPRDFFGFAVGDDYMLANYKQYSAYLNKIDKESDRIKVLSIGKTEEGRDQLMAVVTSPANLRNLEKYRKLATQLASGQPASAEDAKRLAVQGKTVVWIDGGLHATEVLGAQQLIESIYQLASRDDAETKRLRDDVITLFVHANPDGMDLVSDWYMRNSEKERRSMGGLPRLYEKYAGHDNNRDFYACNLAESINMNRILYTEWCPQILYNHHQTSPPGTVIFVPPFRPPYNHHVDPLAQVQTDLVGMAMHQRFVAEGKPGAVMRSAASYQTWWNGGLRTTAYFHNMVGILTEAMGSPTPGSIPYMPGRLVKTNDMPFPIEPQPWRFRQSIEYEVTANFAILDLASRQRETLLFNTWRMARNAIEKGMKDTWTDYPARVAANTGGFQGLRKPELRDAKAYVIPAFQADFPTACKFANALIKNGVQVLRAKSSFVADGKSYPAGSLVVNCAQAYRAHVLDMFEPQDYPNDFQYPGGPPIAPYDSAGYTLAYTMGVQFDRILEKFEGDFEPIAGMVLPPEGSIMQKRSLQRALVLNCSPNDAFTAVALMLKAGIEVRRHEAVPAPTASPAFYIAENADSLQLARKVAKELGLSFGEMADMPNGMPKLAAPRVALLDRYGGSMESGWTRWILERFQIPFTVIYPPDIDAGGLKDKFDTLILVSGMTFGGGPGGGGGFGVGEGIEEWTDSPLQGGGGGQGNLRNDPTIPEELRRQMGSLTPGTSYPKVKEFLEAGGRVVAIGSATGIARQLNLPVASALTETVDGKERALPRDKFYCPGSVLRMKVDTAQPAAWGITEDLDVMSDNSPAFKFLDGAEAAGLKKIAWFDTDKPLRSGWCWGQAYLKGAIAAYEAPIGKGKLYAFGPEILFRGQTHASFKFLFNVIFGG